MRALDRKLIRDLQAMKGQAIAICSVMACGVATFVMSLSTLHSLDSTQKTYYERYRFGDVFVHLKRAPMPLVNQIAEIPGVGAVQARVVVDVNLDVPGMTEPAVGRLISIPERITPGLNELHLRRGRYIEPGRKGEVLASEAFVEAHGLNPGDRIVAIINGRRQSLQIVGIALSPEYVYSIREGELFPDSRRFGVFWMGYPELAPAYDMQGAFNDLAVALAPGASEPEVLRRLDRLTGPYGGLAAFGRADQLSNRFVSNELVQLRGMAVIAPVIFLVVTAFLLNVVLSRLVSTQREQIAALKAFGYTRFEIGLHYGKLVLGLVVIGVAVGTLVGAWLGHGLTQVYTKFFRFPVFGYALDASVVLSAFAITGVAALLGTLGAVRRAAALPPAEAMRPEPPAHFRPTVLERLGLQRLFSLSVRMILRNVQRHPLRAALSCLGIALSIAVLILGNCTVDAIDYVIDFQFFAAQRQDLNVAFVEQTSPRSLHDLGHLPGVQHVEPYRTVPARIRFGPRSRRLGVLGLPPERRLFRLLDRDEKDVALPPEGLVVSEKLAEILGCRLGDELSVEVLEGSRPTRQVRVTGFIRDFTEPGAYMDLHALHRLMREGDCLSGAFLAVDDNHLNDLYAELKKTPKVSSVNVKRAVLVSFQNTLAENLLRMQLFNVIFASVIAFGVVYNSARISLSERSRDLATLRVMGFTRREISAILLGELALLTLVAIPFGLVFGYGFAGVLSWALDTETQRFPLVVSPSTYAFAVSVTMVAGIVSGLVVRRRLDQLDLVAVLKARE
jgi:putative ABC transport system permease protein